MSLHTPIEDATKDCYLDDHAVYNALQINVEGDHVDGEGQRYAVQNADVLFANGLPDAERLYAAVAERSGDVGFVWKVSSCRLFIRARLLVVQDFRSSEKFRSCTCGSLPVSQNFCVFLLFVTLTSKRRRTTSQILRPFQGVNAVFERDVFDIASHSREVLVGQDRRMGGLVQHVQCVQVEATDETQRLQPGVVDKHSLMD